MGKAVLPSLFSDVAVMLFLFVTNEQLSKGIFKQSGSAVRDLKIVKF